MSSRWEKKLVIGQLTTSLPRRPVLGATTGAAIVSGRILGRDLRIEKMIMNGAGSSEVLCALCLMPAPLVIISPWMIMITNV
jgi:hypothetical protein